jgi:SynChlorMet cassette protein ScmC
MQLSLLEDPMIKITLLSDNFESCLDRANKTFLDQSIKSENLLLENNNGKFFSTDLQDSWISSLSEQLMRAEFYKQLSYISVLIHLITQSSGGLFIHGALAEKDNWGVIFAGYSGVGKTTTVSRLPSPWQPLSDETTLVIRDSHGAYWAHPMPTRSRFIEDGPGGTWNVQHAVPLKGIFFLLQNDNDHLHRMTVAEAIYLINGFANEALDPLLRDTEYKRKYSLLKQIFDNSYDLAKSIPVYILKLSLTGKFWNQVDQAILVEK